MEVFRYGEHYSDEVVNAVRYGYQYRKEAEDEDKNRLHYFLSISEIALWLGKLILDGFAWDTIKAMARSLYGRIVKSDTKLDELSKTLLMDEIELERFYTCLKEFQDHCMKITQKQFEYIREEICADYFAKESSKIIESEGRFPSNEEIMNLHKLATSYADSILKSRMNTTSIWDTD